MPSDGADGAIGAIVVVLRAGDALARTLDALAWAARCAVLDPAGLAEAVELPSGCVRVTDSAAALAALAQPWVWLLTDCESAPPATQAAIRALTQWSASITVLPVTWMRADATFSAMSAAADTSVGAKCSAAMLPMILRFTSSGHGW